MIFNLQPEKKIDKDGLLLCDLQARTFELSSTAQDTSSPIFIRRFMNSKTAKELDNLAILETNMQATDILERIDEEYGKSAYGSLRYSKEELFWIGYIYRYFSYTYEISSLQAYRIVKAKELRGLFIAYHTMDPAQAIDRILETRKPVSDKQDEISRQYNIFKTIRTAK